MPRIATLACLCVALFASATPRTGAQFTGATGATDDAAARLDAHALGVLTGLASSLPMYAGVVALQGGAARECSAAAGSDPVWPRVAELAANTSADLLALAADVRVLTDAGAAPFLPFVAAVARFNDLAVPLLPQNCAPVAYTCARPDGTTRPLVVMTSLFTMRGLPVPLPLAEVSAAPPAVSAV